MLRRIIHIDQEKCNGCGLCAEACHEQAIRMVNGKATLIRDDYCDGLGDCLPSCPVSAITFEEREALAYNEEEVKRNMRNSIQASGVSTNSELHNWPIQIKLAPISSPMYHTANLLIAADCTAFSYAGFHQEFINNSVVLIGCSKLDQVSYVEKLSQIFAENEITSVHVVRMEVPCCGGMSHTVQAALHLVDKEIPYQETIITRKGTIV